jgi:hypothetical protein
MYKALTNEWLTTDKFARMQQVLVCETNWGGEEKITKELGTVHTKEKD